ncbi:hypothetical protein FVEG_16551 [Fusarium verticillioides 7600]|uniref:Uncharacterized protein n=1 Tax=Gibberella moniliformis (strain M3125 / FGSC 7600) TaxID=334819 RepID=W7MQN9_GIBM7|nr:hypothetical protein FVEG_16551 [Fusarium verticillioides 7600]EWG49945.1 hypothetical protein FVEG_16551 [Fusarium verticillioides 7600]
MTALDVNAGSRSSFLRVWTSIYDPNILTQRLKTARLI